MTHIQRLDYAYICDAYFLLYTEGMTTRYSEFLSGVRDELPILLGAIPFGLIYGVTALAMGIPAVVAQAMSFIIFAGSAQFVIAQLVGAGTPPIVIVLTAFIINIRHALYSASVAPFTKKLPAGWKWLLSYLLTDEAYAVTILHYRKIEQAAQHGNEIERNQHTHWYFLGAGLALWTTWQASTALGIFLGAQIPSSWSLDFASTLTFIALVVPSLKDRASIGTALTAGTVAILAASLPFKLSIAVATVIGIAVGLGIEQVLSRTKRQTVEVMEQEEMNAGERV